jgi:hypothetical protein
MSWRCLLDKARNDLSAAVPKFNLALEEHRRTPDGRVRTSQELLTSFFPHDDKTCTDKIFKYLPNEVRGPIVAAWGIRGTKAALRDNDEKIQQVVHDALVAGDVDHSAFEEGLTPETLVRWVPLADLWSFWRGGKLTKQAIHKALSTAYELYLFDARWFLDTINSKGGALKGTDVLSDGLTKDELTQWIHRIHEAADGTPKGLVAALGWDKIVAKTPNDVLVAVLDAMVTKVGLVVAGTPGATSRDSTPRVFDPLHKSDAKAEATPAATPSSPTGATPAAAGEAPKSVPDKVEVQNPTEKPPAAEDSWSAVPPPPEPSSAVIGDDGINVILEDDVLIAAPAIPAVRARAISTVDEEDTQVKRLGRRNEPSGRGPSRH